MTIHPEPQIAIPDSQIAVSHDSSLVLNYTTCSSYEMQINQNEPVENEDISSQSNVAVDVRKDEEVIDGVPGIVGIYNIGNTCFMNSAIQCILATQNLKELFETDFSDALVAASFLKPLIEQFQIVFAKVFRGKYSVLFPKKFHETVASLHPLFGDFKQHDSQEFISFVLNIIHDFLNLSQPKQSALQNTSQSITGDVSKRLKMDSSSMEIDEEIAAPEEEKAEFAWQDYIKLNKTIISEQFQGQYQSVMKCGTCKFVSITFEPFMTLSLSIPFAMEKQIIVTWVSSPKVLTPTGVPRVKRFLLTVKKNGLVEELKKHLIEFLKKDEDTKINVSNIVLAEVRNHAHVKILDNKTQLKYLSKSFSVFAIEILNNSVLDNSQNNGCHDDSMASPDDNGVATWHTCNICFEEKFEEDLLVHRSCNGALCADCLQGTIQHSQTASGQFPCPSCSSYINTDGGYEPMLKKPQTEVKAEEKATQPSVSMETDESSAQQTTWRKCSICLNETFDDEMRIHNSCGGLICHSCVNTTATYHDNGEFPCPTCSVIISEKDYVKLTPSENEGGRPNRQRKVMVPVMFRYCEPVESKKKFTMFGSPHITCLPAETTTEQVKKVIELLVQKYNVSSTTTSTEIFITDSSGTSCGMCDFTTGCTGCRVSDSAELKFKPGCCLSITFSEENQSVVNTLNFSKDDDSVKLLRSTDVVTLDECMEKFVDVEELGEDNPWFCPECNANRVSEKVMSVTRWPDTLIVHLKRFHYDEAQGNKITCPIEFPLTDLKVEIMTCPKLSKRSRVYDLYGIVNHTGTLFGGHYTSFTKQPGKQWYNFNDETFKEMCPTEDADYRTEAYVLFYQAKD